MLGLRQFHLSWHFLADLFAFHVCVSAVCVCVLCHECVLCCRVKLCHREGRRGGWVLPRACGASVCVCVTEKQSERRAARADPTGNDTSAMLRCPICLERAVSLAPSPSALVFNLRLIADGTKRETRPTDEFLFMLIDEALVKSLGFYNRSHYWHEISCQ